MRISQSLVGAATLSAVLLLGCMPQPMPAEPGPSGTGGSSSSGGRGGSGSGSGGSSGSATGGSSGSGGTSAPTAGTTGGSSAGAGGTTGGTAGQGAGGATGTGGSGAGGSAGSGGTGGSGGADGTGGSGAGTGGSTAGTGGARDGGSATPDMGGGNPGGPPFSFFVTSIEAMRKLSGSQNGFGGNLGGLAGADKICQDIAAENGAGAKTWKAFLSATKGGPNGGPVHAIDRIGNGPWYDRNGRLVSMDRAGLLRGPRPAGVAQAVVDLANERGQIQKPFGDNHDVITGSNKMGMLSSTDPASTCQDWTSAAATRAPNLMCGHSWSRVGSQHWLSEHSVPGCAPGVNLRDNTVMPGNCIGCNGGYGAIYCFALTP